MAKRRKLKKQVWIVFIVLLFLIIGIYSGINIYKEYKYKQTYEYKLIQYGYTLDEAQILLDAFENNEEREFLLSIEKDSDIIPLVQEKYFLKKNFKEYLSYKEKNKKKENKDIIRTINIHIDQDFYSLDLKTDPTLDTLMLVNKFYLLDASYAPDDLISIPSKYAWGEVGSKKVRQIAYDAFINMWDAAQEDGYYLMVNSAYRSYEEQDNIYTNYKTTRGQKYADSIAARPGSSEHQTGLTLDIFSKSNSNKATFADSAEAAWLKDNAHKYGFILRYPENKENITGYNYEAWHYRYIGVEAATYCYENDIIFEEYYAYFIEK